MDKSDFLQQWDVPEELAEQAWEQADGDPENASALLEPVELTLKGKLKHEESNLYGLLLVKWDLRDDALIGNRAVVVNVALSSISTQDSGDEFYKKITELEDTPNLLSGYTDSLKESIEDLLSNEDNDFPVSLLDGDLDEFTEVLQEQLKDSLDLRDLDLNIESSVRRNINKETIEEEPAEDEEEEEVNVPACDVHVTPVQGVSVEKLQPDDMIYVELGDIPEGWGKLRPVLEDLRDDSGLIPAQLRTKKGTDEGRLELQVQFGKKVYGTISCGRDVSLMVPDETREKYDQQTGFDPENLLNATTIGIAAVVVLIIVLVFLIL